MDRLPLHISADEAARVMRAATPRAWRQCDRADHAILMALALGAPGPLIIGALAALATKFGVEDPAPREIMANLAAFARGEAVDTQRAARMAAAYFAASAAGQHQQPGWGGTPEEMQHEATMRGVRCPFAAALWTLAECAAGHLEFPSRIAGVVHDLATAAQTINPHPGMMQEYHRRALSHVRALAGDDQDAPVMWRAAR